MHTDSQFGTSHARGRPDTADDGVNSTPQAGRPGRTTPSPKMCALAALMAQVQAGDEEAFRDLYDATVTIAHATAVRTTWSAEHAAEVVQEVYLYAWQHAGDYASDRGPVLNWLLMLVHRRAVDRVRRVNSASVRDQRDFHRSTTTTPDTAELGIARHEAGRLRVAIGRLSDKQRDALTLTYLHGLTTREAAALLEIPVGTVKTRVRDAIASLRTNEAYGARPAQAGPAPCS